MGYEEWMGCGKVVKIKKKRRRKEHTPQGVAEKMQILDHNLKAYKALIKSFKKANRACIVHPTGLGKSYIAYQLIADNPYSALQCTRCQAPMWST